MLKSRNVGDIKIRLKHVLRKLVLIYLIQHVTRPAQAHLLIRPSGLPSTIPPAASSKAANSQIERLRPTISKKESRPPRLFQNVPLHLRHRAPLPPPLHRHRAPPRHGGVRGRPVRPSAAAVPGPQGGARGGEGPRAGGLLPGLDRGDGALAGARRLGPQPPRRHRGGAPLRGPGQGRRDGVPADPRGPARRRRHRRRALTRRPGRPRRGVPTQAHRLIGGRFPPRSRAAWFLGDRCSEV
jgi:hypothetical protein